MKRAVYAVADAAGLNRLWRARNRNCVAVIRYHRVVGKKHPFLFASRFRSHSDPTVDEFRRQLAIIRSHGTIVSLDHAVGMLSGERPWVPGAAVITFDDGYRNNATHALPVLREFDAPATVFVATDFVDQRAPLWFDRLDCALSMTAVSHLRLALGEGECDWPLETAGQRVAALQQIKTYCKTRHAADVDAVVMAVESATGVRLSEHVEMDDWTAPLDWDQIGDMTRHGVTVGAHTVHHQILTKTSDAELAGEVNDSKHRIEARLQKPCDHFCYPNGGPGDLDGRTREAIVRAGFVSALSTLEGFACPLDDPMALPRLVLPAHGASAAQTLALLSGLQASLLAWRRRIRRDVT